MTAAYKNIVIEQGSKFTLTVIYKDSSGNIIDLTGYTAAMQIRETKSSSTTIADLTSSGGDITITAAAGQLDIEIAATATASMDFVNAYYDLEITPSSGSANTVRILEGKVKFSKEVTR